MRFVCSQGASRMHRRPSVTPVPFPSLIRNYWVVSFSSTLNFIKKDLVASFCWPRNIITSHMPDQYLPCPKCYLMQSVTSQEMERLTLAWSLRVLSHFHHTICKAVCFTYSKEGKGWFLHILSRWICYMQSSPIPCTITMIHSCVNDLPRFWGTVLHVFVSVSSDFLQNLPTLQGESARLGNLWSLHGFYVQI